MTDSKHQDKVPLCPELAERLHKICMRSWRKVAPAFPCLVGESLGVELWSVGVPTRTLLNDSLDESSSPEKVKAVDILEEFINIGNEHANKNWDSGRGLSSNFMDIVPVPTAHEVANAKLLLRGMFEKYLGQERADEILKDAPE